MGNKEKTPYQLAKEDKRDIPFTRKLAEKTPDWYNEIPIEEFDEDDEEDFSDIFELDEEGNFIENKEEIRKSEDSETIIKQDYTKWL